MTLDITRINWLLPRYEDFRRTKAMPRIQPGTIYSSNGEPSAVTFDKNGVHELNDITPCIEQITNEQCPCGSSHLLHWEKESLSYYREAIWSTKCAIKHLLNYMEQQVVSRSEKIEELEWKIEDQKTSTSSATSLLVLAHRTLKKRAEHMADCKAIDPIAAIRGNNPCTCKLDEYNEVIKRIDTFLIGKLR